ncbi:MAG: hypothetical protein DMF88_10105 [Acidobacteria bacterium]|nr:MAG: hypothetical protein DMF88_10105 [Acidobacteriota bacterium]
MTMFRMETLYRAFATALVAAAAMTLGACSLDKQEMPGLAGPSEIVTSLSLTASPDQLPRDGSSQSIVTITARDANGQPLVGQRITLSLGASAPQGAALCAGPRLDRRHHGVRDARGHQCRERGDAHHPDSGHARQHDRADRGIYFQPGFAGRRSDGDVQRVDDDR